MLNIEKYKDEIIKVMSISRTDGALKTVMAVKTGINCRDYANISYKEVMEWLTKEYREPILDKAEKEYLSAVIKPFRKRVLSICKMDGSCDEEYILISTKYTDHASLPYFPRGTMYKGMKSMKKYTLEELGL